MEGTHIARPLSLAGKISCEPNWIKAWLARLTRCPCRCESRLAAQQGATAIPRRRLAATRRARQCPLGSLVFQPLRLGAPFPTNGLAHPLSLPESSLLYGLRVARGATAPRKAQAIEYPIGQ